MHKEGPGNPEHFHTAKKLFKFCSSMLLLRCLLNSSPHNSVTWQHSAWMRACEHLYIHQGEAPGPQGLRWLEASPVPDVAAPADGWGHLACLTVVALILESLWSQAPSVAAPCYLQYLPHINTSFCPSTPCSCIIYR